MATFIFYTCAFCLAFAVLGIISDTLEFLTRGRKQW